MSLAIDRVVRDRLEAMILSIVNVTPPADDVNADILRSMLGGYSTTDQTRIIAQFREQPPTVVLGYGSDDPPPAPFWLVLLQSASGRSVAGLKIGKGAAVVEMGATAVKYRRVGGMWSQRVQIQVRADNPETVNGHFHILQSMMYAVASDAMRANVVSEAKAMTAGAFDVETRVASSRPDTGAYGLRLVEWEFAYQINGYVPADSWHSDIAIASTPVEASS